MSKFIAQIIVDNETAKALKVDTIELYREAEKVKDGTLKMLSLPSGIGFECYALPAFEKALKFFGGLVRK